MCVCVYVCAQGAVAQACRPDGCQSTQTAGDIRLTVSHMHTHIDTHTQTHTYGHTAFSCSYSLLCTSTLCMQPGLLHSFQRACIAARGSLYVCLHVCVFVCSAEDCLELQVPIDCGNGKWNCGVSLARLLWDVPAPALATLMASMLLERRIILVSSQRDTVTAAVQAAAALLYPFK